MPLNPHLLKELTEANTPVVPRDSPGVLADVAMEAMESLEVYPDTFGVNYTAETLIAFNKAYNESIHLFDSIGAVVPTLDAFAKAGVDFTCLAKQYEVMAASNLEPSVVFTNVKLSYSRLRDLRISSGEKQILGPKSAEILTIAPEILRRWNNFTELPASIPSVRVGDENEWTVRLIPATNRLPESLRGVDFASGERVFSHPTISEYITLQARRLAAGEPPLPGACWLFGTPFYADNRGTIPVAAYGQAWSSDDYLHIGWNGIDRTHSMYARPTVG